MIFTYFVVLLDYIMHFYETNEKELSLPLSHKLFTS